MITSDSTAQRFEPRIVFASNRDGDWDIYSMDANGDNLVQLTDHPGSDEYPACSPDGKRIAFVSERGVTRDLYVMDSDGDNVVRLTRDNFREGRPSWTPDGTRFAFSSFRFAVGNSEIYMMDVDGNNLINLTNHKMCKILARVGRQMEARWRLCPSVTGGFNDSPSYIRDECRWNGKAQSHY